MELATKLRNWREEKRWSQLEVALKIGVTQSTYGTWEYNVIPKAKYFTKLAEIFEVDISEFFPEGTMKKVEHPSPEKETLVNKLISTLEDAIKTKDELISHLKEELKTIKNNIFPSQS